ncbi:MAG: glycosidase, partial [Bacteroidota bacterium]
MTFQERDQALREEHQALITRINDPILPGNGIYTRYRYPIITAAHTPLFWRYDFSETDNPFLMERQGINAAFNAGAIYFDERYLMVVRVEGNDRKSFFAVAESANGIDNWQFWDYPITMPEYGRETTNMYDMRLTQHEDGWIYGLFCVERKDLDHPDDLSAAEAQCGIARTKDLKTWERLPDLITYSGQQRNVVLHPEFIEGKYALYTRPQDGFISVGSGGGIGWGLSDSMDGAEIKAEKIVDGKAYHTIKELKNGQGPPPLKTPEGWLHLAHGVRNCAAGLRYVLYLFVTDLDAPWQLKYSPGGHLIAPEGIERVGDVSNVLFVNGWIRNEKDEVFIYYASSDTRTHVATTSIAQLLDYAKNTPSDRLTSGASVRIRNSLISKNL